MRATWLLAAGALAVSGCAGNTRQAPASVPAQEIAPKTSHVATVEPVPAPVAPSSDAAPADAGESEDGVMHIVQPGQTLWRIARAYDVPLETIARANNIADPTRVDVGTPVFIPGVRATIDVAPFPAPLPGQRRSMSLPIATAGAYTWPVQNGEFMRPFGEPRLHHIHAGVDIRGLRGQDIRATRDGVVAFSGPTASGYGTMVILDHGDGVQSLYAHAQTVLVHTGDSVTRGEPIARVGRTGNATTEHCHFELRLENHPVDPMPYFQSVAQVRR
jgi:murein DD-endopeptidase MepM/ murein hydrolase activator NlpD